MLRVQDSPVHTEAVFFVAPLGSMYSLGGVVILAINGVTVSPPDAHCTVGFRGAAFDHPTCAAPNKKPPPPNEGSGVCCA